MRLTATHAVAAGDRNGAVLCDADLAVLRRAPQRVRRRTSRECAASTHTSTTRPSPAGRAAVLRSLLDRPVMFRTAHGRREWEDAARANVTTELASLAAGS